MPTTSDMSLDDDIYRAVLEHDFQPVRFDKNPNNPRGPLVRVPAGPVEVKQFVIGPYTETRSIKGYMTRNKGYHMNLRLVRVEKVAKWEEVSI